MKRSNTFSWLDATKFVLSKSEEAMCQTQILQKISDLGLKDTRVPNSGELVMRALLANSTGKNPIICKVEDKKFVINDNCKSTIFNHDSFSASRRQLPQRKKAKIISEDFVDSDSVFDTKDDKISYSPYSSYNFHHARKNKRMRTRPAVSVPRISVKPAILLKDAVNMAVQPSESNRATVQEMFNGNSDIMKYDGITRKCLNMEEFLKLSKCQQRYLATLLPGSDVRKDRNNIKLAPSALSNPFFASFFREWHDKLCKGELSVDFKTKIKTETDRQVAKDPWKETFFEDVWGFSRADEMKSKKEWHRQRPDTFEDDIKEALSGIPSSFLIAPVQDPIQDTLTPPTSDSSEHDRTSHLLGCNGTHDTSHDTLSADLDKELHILTPDHEPENALTPPAQQSDHILTRDRDTDHELNSLSETLASLSPVPDEDESLETHLDSSIQSEDDKATPEVELVPRSSPPSFDVLDVSASSTLLSEDAYDVDMVVEDAVEDRTCNIPDTDEQIIAKPVDCSQECTDEIIDTEVIDSQQSLKFVIPRDISDLSSENIVEDTTAEQSDYGQLSGEESATIDSCFVEPLTDEPISIDQLHEELELSSAPTSPCPDPIDDESSLRSPETSPSKSAQRSDSPQASNHVTPSNNTDNSDSDNKTSSNFSIKEDFDLEKNDCSSEDDIGQEDTREDEKVSWTKDLRTTDEDSSKFIGDLDLDLELESSDSIIPGYDVKHIRSLEDLDDPDLTFDFISDRTCDVTLLNKAEEPLNSTKSAEDHAPIKTITKLEVSDDISLNIMNEMKNDLALSMPEKIKKQEKHVDERLKMPEVTREPPCNILNSLKSYNSPGTSSSSAASSPKVEQKERLTLKILKKDILFNAEDAPPLKKHKSKKHKSKHSFLENKSFIPGIRSHESDRMNVWSPGYHKNACGPMLSAGQIPSKPHMSVPPASHILPPPSGRMSSAGQMIPSASHTPSTGSHIPGHMTATTCASSAGHVMTSCQVTSASHIPPAGHMTPTGHMTPAGHMTPTGLITSAGQMTSAGHMPTSSRLTPACHVTTAPLSKPGHVSPYLQIGCFKRDSVQYNVYSDEEAESELNRISLQQQLLAEKGIKSSCVPVEHTQSLVKNMREKQAHQGSLPKLAALPQDDNMIVLDSGSQRPQKPVTKDTVSVKFPSKAPTSGTPSPYNRGAEHTDNIRNALKAKISQRRYCDLPSSSSSYPTQSSGNHCCYVVKGCPGECVCSTAPMLFCTKCFHLSHSSCSNVLCSNCGSLFKFN